MINRKKTVLINGFGRIGRAVLKIILNCKNFEIIAINDKNPDLKNMVYLYKYDSTYGISEQAIYVNDNCLNIDDTKIRYFSETNLLNVFNLSLEFSILISSINK